MNPVVSLDIGGRSIKYTIISPINDHYCIIGGINSSYYMELEFEKIFKKIITKIPEDPSCIGVIMSYPISCKTYREGLGRIVALFQKVLPEPPVFFIDYESRMWPLDEVLSTDPARFAMSNFFGSAYLGSKIRDHAVVMDTGSTSTDILLTAGNRPVAIGQDTDTIRRQMTGEMTWTGIIATPISSVTESLPLRGCLVKGSPHGGTMNDVYNILHYEQMRDILRIYGVRQQELEKYYHDIATYFAYDLENIESVEIKNIAQYISVKHVEIVAGFLIQVLSHHKLNIHNTDFVLMGIGKDILLKKVLRLLDVEESHIFDAADYVPGELWAHGSSIGAALRTLDHVRGENIALSEIEGESEYHD